MGKLFGEKHRLNCKTVQEAMHAIDVMKGGMRQYLMDCTENGVHFTVQKGEEFLDQQEVGLELGKDDIIISPVPKGAANDIVKIIVGITLMIIGFTVDPSGNAAKVGLQMLATIGANLALAGIIGLMTDDPEELNEEEPSEETTETVSLLTRERKTEVITDAASNLNTTLNLPQGTPSGEEYFSDKDRDR